MVNEMRMLRLARHRRRRQASDLARLLVALDAVSGGRPSARRRRTGFLSLSR
jgi:hypothetical protein